MRIAHVTATFPPYLAGTGNVAFHNARVLQARGHDVTVFTAPVRDGEELSFSFQVERLEALFRIGNAPLLPSLASKLSGFDLVHLHYPFIFGSEAVLLAARRGRLPLVVTYHNRLEESTGLKKGLFGLYNRLVEPRVLARADRLIAVRLGHFLSLYPDFAQSKLSEVPNGVATELFRPYPKAEARRELGLPPAAPLALFVGALDQAHRFKNVSGLLRAFARSRADARLIIAGDGDLRPSFEAEARALEITDRVHFLGRRTPEDLPSIYSAADVTVLPSLGVESFGMVLIESMACGTPVISSDLPGVRDLVTPGRDGFSVPVGDLDALAKTLDQIWEAGRSEQMGRCGRDKVVAHYDWRVIAERLEGVYLEVLADHRAKVAR